MKTKTKLKLSLNKETITRLNVIEQQQIKGGSLPTESCPSLNCPPRFTDFVHCGIA